MLAYSRKRFLKSPLPVVTVFPLCQPRIVREEEGAGRDDGRSIVCKCCHHPIPIIHKRVRKEVIPSTSLLNAASSSHPDATVLGSAHQLYTCLNGTEKPCHPVSVAVMQSILYSTHGRLLFSRRKKDSRVGFFFSPTSSMSRARRVISLCSPFVTSFRSPFIVVGRSCSFAIQCSHRFLGTEAEAINPAEVSFLEVEEITSTEQSSDSWSADTDGSRHTTFPIRDGTSASSGRRLDLCSEIDSSSTSSAVPPGILAASSQSLPCTFKDVRKTDTFSRGRVVSFIRTRKKINLLSFFFLFLFCCYVCVKSIGGVGALSFKSTSYLIGHH